MNWYWRSTGAPPSFPMDMVALKMKIILTGSYIPFLPG
jgi:hypothetical protein